jgi:hypothetical protein
VRYEMELGVTFSQKLRTSPSASQAGSCNPAGLKHLIPVRNGCGGVGT